MDVRGVELEVKRAVEPLAESMGLTLLDVELSSEGAGWFLRLYIDKESGVGIDDCARLSEEADGILDGMDPIPHAYVLEVTSSGEKPLRFAEEYAKFSGRNVLISTYKQVSGQKRHEGKLIGLMDGEVVIEDDEGKQSRIPFELVSKARLAARY